MTSDEIVGFLRTERVRKHLLQQDLCIRSDGELSGAMMSLYERERCEPTLPKAVAWARSLGYELTLVPVGTEKSPADAVEDGTTVAVKKLRGEYAKALRNPSVETPLCYALYHTWRWFDARKENTL